MEINKITYDGEKISIAVKERDGGPSITYKRKLSGNTEFDNAWKKLSWDASIYTKLTDSLFMWPTKLSVNDDMSVNIAFDGWVSEKGDKNCSSTFELLNVNADNIPAVEAVFMEAVNVLATIKTHISDMQMALFDDLLDDMKNDGVTVEIATGIDEQTGEIYDDPGDVDDDMVLAAEDTGELGVDDTEQRAMTIRSRRMHAVNEG